MSTNDRKQELERKKAKLAALREQKNRRDVSKPIDSSTNGTESLGGISNGRMDTDELLKTLGIPLPDASADADNKVSSTNHHSASRERITSPSRRPKLTVSKTNELGVPPRDPICYAKQTQTKGPATPQHFSGALHNDSPRETLNSPRFIAHLEWEDEFSLVLPFDDSMGTLLDKTVPLASPNSRSFATASGDHKRGITPRQADSDSKYTVSGTNATRQLDEEERAAVFESHEFSDFFGRASRIMERVLDEPADVFIDYSGAEPDDTSNARHQLVHCCRDFYDDRWSKKRSVTALDWSPTFPELLLAAYNSNEDSPHEPDGICLIWNLKFQKNTPEYIFHCQSPITSATLATYHPNLVIGGTYSGQIVLWDNRSSKRTPVQRTVLSATAHTHPIHEITVVGTQNAHNLISVSSDGKLCSWSLDMLSQPQQSMELTYRQTRSVAATSMSFVHQDVNNFLVGSEDGRIYTGSRHGNQAGITEMFEGHQTPITSVNAFAAEGHVDFSHLFLSTSFDSSVSLWSMKDTRPIYTMEEASDIVLDSDWSPLHPAMFSTVDSSGQLNLWNLNQDTEVPVSKTKIEAQTSLNKCCFHSSGLRIATGDILGRIYVYDLNESMVSPRPDEWSTFARTLDELRQLSIEREERETDALRMPLH